MMQGSQDDAFNFRADSAVPIPGEPTPDPQPNKTQPSFMDDFVARPVDTVQNLTLDMKIHLGLAAGISMLCFLIWHYTAVNPAYSFWWWIFVFFFFGLTLTAHFYYKANELFFRGLVVLAIEVNLMLFVTDGITSNGFPDWFFYPWGVSAVIGLIVYYTKFSNAPRITMIFYVYIITCVVLFLAWLVDPTRAFPWFFIPVCVLAIPVAIFYMRDTYGETRWYLYLAVGLFFLNLMLFFIWGFTSSGWPWFVIPLGASLAIVAFLFYRYKDDNYSFARVPGAADAPATPAPSGAAGYENL